MGLENQPQAPETAVSRRDPLGAAIEGSQDQQG
jgi:hypothetical protein